MGERSVQPKGVGNRGCAGGKEERERVLRKTKGTVGVLIPSPATGYNVLASFILRTLPVLYSELPQNLGKTFKLTYAKLLKCLVWLAKG
jgi:hypothetical protein